MIEWINLISITVNYALFAALYTLSVQPMKRTERRGKKAWRDCAIFRIISSIFLFLLVTNEILWIWYPVPGLDWKVDANWSVATVVGLVITIPGMIILLKGEHDARRETMIPSAHTKPFGGIYNCIRHPQTLGEFSIFAAIGFFVNSWFLVVCALFFIIIYTPIMIHYEEADLVKRFGNSYVRYRERTGAWIPKFRRRKDQKE